MSDAASAPDRSTLTVEQIRDGLRDLHNDMRASIVPNGVYPYLTPRGYAILRGARDLIDKHAKLTARIAEILPHRYDGGAEPHAGAFPCFYCGGTLDSQQHVDDCVWLQSLRSSHD